MSTVNDYGKSGVDIDEGNRAVDMMKDALRSTYNDRVLGDVGHFGGLYRAEFPGCGNPVLVASTDGVGTKLRVASMASTYLSVGKDLVNHCVNDILVQGASPLFFMDYIACGRLDARIVSDIVSGLAAACVENGAVLLGGETAEMPGFYADGDYDVAGTIIGVVDRDGIVDGREITPSMKVIGLASTGLHTNGFSLARRVLFESAGFSVHDNHPLLGDRTIGEALLEVHRSYLSCIKPLLGAGIVKGLCHVTGGGIPGNLARILPDNCDAVISWDWSVQGIFELIASAGEVSTSEMRKVFNMGAGMLVVVRDGDFDTANAILRDSGEIPFEAGEIVLGSGGVTNE